MLSAVERRIEQYIDSLNDKDAKRLYSSLPRGKRLRARLILTIANNNPLAIKLASIVEMIHASSLLHDDVIDDALLRRGKKSLNAIYGNKSAIMFGDILYSKAFYELVDMDRAIAKIISNAVVQLSLGERKDVLLGESFNPDLDEYMDMVYKKTASLIEASAKASALLAGKDIKPYGIYGKNLGIAFQIIDDILDITQDSKTLGKPSMQDFKEGKTTLPFILLYQRLNDKDKLKLKSLHKRVLNDSNREWIKSKMAETKALEDASKMAHNLANEAITLMERENEESLKEIAKKMIERDF